MRTYESIRKIATGQGDNSKVGYLLDYPYFEKHTMIAIDSSRQQALDADTKANQKTNFIRNLDHCRRYNSFSLKKQNKLLWIFKRNCVINSICFNTISKWNNSI